MASRGKAAHRRTASRRDREHADHRSHIEQLYAHIYEVVRRIPRGRVATYGQVAELAGIPGGARVVGAAMRASQPEMALPWQRVVGKRSRTTAQVSIHDPVGAAVQRGLLEDEGVALSDAGAISLSRHGWLPTEQGPRPAAKPPRRRARRNAKARRS